MELQTEDLLLMANGSCTTDAEIDLEEILASVTAGGTPPVLTKQVLDKLLAAAAAAAAAKLTAARNLPSPQKSADKDIHSSLPNLNEAPKQDEAGTSSSSNGDSPTDPSPTTDGCAPRKSNLSGKVKSGQDARQLSVRFDPKQVIIIFVSFQFMTFNQAAKILKSLWIPLIGTVQWNCLHAGTRNCRE